MKYYKDDESRVYAYESDGSQDEFIPDNQIAISEEVAQKLINEQKKLAEKLMPPEQLIKRNDIKRTELINEANEKIAVLQDIIDLDMQESNEEEQLKQWKKYRILLTRIDVSDTNISFPTKPE